MDTPSFVANGLLRSSYLLGICNGFVVGARSSRETSLSLLHEECQRDDICLETISKLSGTILEWWDLLMQKVVSQYTDFVNILEEETCCIFESHERPKYSRGGSTIGRFGPRTIRAIRPSTWLVSRSLQRVPSSDYLSRGSKEHSRAVMKMGCFHFTLLVCKRTRRRMFLNYSSPCR